MSVDLARLQTSGWLTGQPWTFFLVVWGALAVASGFDFYYTLGVVENAETFAASAEGGTLSRRVSLMALAAFSIYVMTFQQRAPSTFDPVTGSLIVLFLVWCVLSIIWAENPGFVVRRLIVLALLTIGAFAFAARCSLHQIITFALLSSLLTLGLSFLAELSLGTFMSGPRPSGAPYRFSGLVHPNKQGAICGLLMISAIFMYGSIRQHRRLFIAIILVATTFLLLSKSRTAALSVVVALGFIWLVFSPLTKRLAVVLGAALVVPILYLLIGDWFEEHRETVLMMGRANTDPTTLTGRIPLWDHLFEYIALRPIAGYGYDGFWIPTHVSNISIAHDWPIVQAHSGWITIILDLGFVGLVLFAAAIVGGIVKSLSCYRRTTQAGYLFAATSLIWLAVVSFAESMFLVPGFPSFVCMSLLAHMGFFANRHDDDLNVTLDASGR